jgi:hypothetical protein
MRTSHASKVKWRCLLHRPHNQIPRATTRVDEGPTSIDLGVVKGEVVSDA